MDKLRPYEIKMKKYSLVFAVLIIVVGILRFLIAKLTTSSWNHKEDWIDIVRYLIIGVYIFYIYIN